jgi:hypothetical protein
MAWDSGFLCEVGHVDERKRKNEKKGHENTMQ